MGRRRTIFARVMRTFGLPMATLAIAAIFLTHALSAMLGPTRLAQSIALRLQRVRGRYIAEDVFQRALAEAQAIRLGRRVAIEEGELSPRPDRPAIVELTKHEGRQELRCYLHRDFQEMVFAADYSRGVLPAAMGWALGEGDPAVEPFGPDVVVRGPRARLSRDPSDPDVHPLAITGAFDVAEDLCVRSSELLDVDAEDSDINLRNFRLSPELPLRHLQEPTDLDDIELGMTHEHRLVAAFRADRDLVVRVHGHLWVGRRDRPLLLGTGGRSLVILVTGNVYVHGSIQLLGPRDRLTVLAGRPRWPAYRDRDGNGRRDQAEEELAHGREDGLLSPREGAGLIYLGSATVRPIVSATLIANHDVIVGAAGAAVEGAVLAGGRLLRVGRVLGLLELGARPIGPPARGLPVLPGTEAQEQVRRIRLVSARARSAADEHETLR